RQWWRSHPNNPHLRFGVALVADRAAEISNLARELLSRPNGNTPDVDSRCRGSSRAYQRQPVDSPPRRLAFVYPGLGNEFPGMGRALSALWPGILHAQESRTDYLRDQLAPDVWWSGELPRSFAGHRVPILGNIALASLVTDLLRAFELAPDGAIGYSLGETAALVALRAWPDRDPLLRRFRASPLFHTELAGPCDAARR